MTELKLDSSSIDSIQLSTCEAVCRIAMTCEVPFMIVGASARDLVMHHGYGAAILRATRDVDIAIQVSDWSAFDTMRDNLTKEGYSKTDAPHRLMSSGGIPLDIIPFGPIENETGKIDWPPHGDVEMGVAGFQEAWETQTESS